MTATLTITPEQLQRINDAISAGLDADEAIEAVFPPAQAKRPVTMITEFPDGIVIGWDTCSSVNSGCGLHISRCTCKGGPKELKVFEQWRQGEKTMPDYGKAANAARRSGVPSTGTIGGTETGIVVVATQPKPVTPANSVPCREGKHFAPIGEAEKNDDGSYTCLACQTAGVQIERE